MYPRMLQVDEVCKHLYIFSNPSIQPGQECFVIPGVVKSFYGLCSLSLIFGVLVKQELMYNHTE